MSIGRDGIPLGNPNVCSDPYQPSFWLGKPGALTQIRVPDAGYQRALYDGYSVHSLLDGQAADRSPYQCRSWAFSHQWLRPEIMTIFMEYATRQRGFGPFVLIDPQAKNLLTPNQASGTDALHSTEGFSVTGTGESLSSSTAWSVQGERCLDWSLTPPQASFSGILRIPTPTNLYGWCLPPGSYFAFSGQIKQGIASAQEGVTLNANPYFETNASSWTAAGGTIARSTVQAHQGVASGLLTPDGVTGTTEVSSDNCAVTVGNTYKVSAWIWPAVSRTVFLGINWFTAGLGFISNTSVSQTLPSQTWTLMSMTAVAPATAAFGVLRIAMIGTPPTSNFLYFDEARFRQPATDISVAATPRVVLMDGSGVVQSTINGTTINTVTGSGQSFCVTGQVPVGTGGVYLEPQISVSQASVTGSADVLIDQLQLEKTIIPGCTTWEYGQGQPLVSVRSDGETVPRVLRTNVNYICVEVT